MEREERRREGRRRFVSRINFPGVPRALIASASPLPERRPPFSRLSHASETRGFRQIKYFSVVIDVPYRRYGTALLMTACARLFVRSFLRSFIRSSFARSRARLLESGGIRAYAVTFDRETFDDATEQRVIKHIVNTKKSRKKMYASHGFDESPVYRDRSRVLRRFLEISASFGLVCFRLSITATLRNLFIWQSLSNIK